MPGISAERHSADLDQVSLMQIAVALMRRFYYPLGGKDDAAKAFAKALHSSWGVGNPACQNGVLLFLAVESRHVSVSGHHAICHIWQHTICGKCLDAYELCVCVRPISALYGREHKPKEMIAVAAVCGVCL